MKFMRAKQTIYRTADGKAVPEGDANARFLIVRRGSEISERELDKFEGARELAENEAVSPTEAADADESKAKRGRPAKNS